MGHQVEALDGYTPVLSPLKPLLRGVSHQHAFFAAVSAGVMLVLSAPTRQGKLACSIYAFTLSTLFGVSATYHRKSWNPELAAAYCGGSGLELWLASGRNLSGVGQINAPKRVSTCVYLMLGWALLPHVKEVAEAMGPISSALLLAGGLCYSVGAIIYAAKYPDPVPKVFGYHEVFHALVIAASIFHFAVIYMVVHGMVT